ncbi:MAG: hypothetical protein IIC01_12125 [Planctomycetes bacterium]|nr:hypothetical protein [Planctomycetota bacterium]
MINCTFSKNRASQTGGGIHDELGRIRVVNSILWGNSVRGAFGESEQIHFARPETFDVNHSCVQGWTGALGGQGNTGNDPLFLDVEEGDLRLRPESPCIDAGDSSVLPPDVADLDGDGDTTEPVPVAIDGLPRFMNDPFTPDVGIGSSAIVDMGAYEYAPVFTLDVQPGRCPNWLSPRRRGTVNVAIVATPEFELWRINLASLALTRVDGRGGAVTPLKRRGRMAVRFADVATPFFGNGCDCHDLRADGTVDRVVTFSARDVFDLLELGSIEPGAPIPLHLVGQLIDGSVFEVSDCLQLQERSHRGP